MDGHWPEVDVEEGLDLTPFDETALVPFASRVLDALFAFEGRTLRISVHFCSDAAMCALHEEWLGDPSSTDVMSFPLGDDSVGDLERASEFAGEVSAQGELIVCLDHARAQAALYGNPFMNEVALYLVHGALHLLGFDDHDSEELERMKTSEERVLAHLGLGVKGRHTPS